MTDVFILPHLRPELNPTAGLADRIIQDLRLALPESEEVTVVALVEGFETDYGRKVIVAVESRDREPAPDGRRFRSLIAKLGAADDVGADFDGWASVVEDLPLSPRLFLPPRRVNLEPGPDGDPRCAVLYENVAHFYRHDTRTDFVLTLHDAVTRCIENDVFDAGSIVRVIRTIFQELGQTLFRFADPGAQAMDFYREKLRLGRRELPSIHTWEDELLPLRRAANWLFNGNTPPDRPERALYHDPFDYVTWLLDHGSPPLTLVGPSHGDLHGRNVLLDYTGDEDSTYREVQNPVLIDYGDMGRKNVPMWDFAKLEMELKVRLVSRLYDREDLRDELLSDAMEVGGMFHRLVARWQEPGPGARLLPIDETNRRLLFSLMFERRLSARFEQILQSDDLSDDRPILREATQAPSKIDLALVLLHAIRRESARWLCKHAGRANHGEWRNEFDFCQAVYGLSTAKYSDNTYFVQHRMAALVAAGVAMDRFERRNRLIDDACREGGDPTSAPSYMVPLYRGYDVWKRAKDWEGGLDCLAVAVERFAFSVPLARDRVLVMARSAMELENYGDPRGPALRAQAKSVIRDLESLFGPALKLADVSRAFNDLELLSRAGRIFKDLGDIEWQSHHADARLPQLAGSLARRYYKSAKEYYRVAYEMSDDHYPGGNYAVTALLAGQPELAQRVAREVIDLLHETPLPDLSEQDQFWMFATEVTMRLICGEAGEAGALMEHAMEFTDQDFTQALQTTYDQFCRLYSALDTDVFTPLLEALRRSPIALTRGPLTDCGDFTSFYGAS